MSSRKPRIDICFDLEICKMESPAYTSGTVIGQFAGPVAGSLRFEYSRLTYRLPDRRKYGRKLYQLEPHRVAGRDRPFGDDRECRGKHSLYGCLRLPDRPR